MSIAIEEKQKVTLSIAYDGATAEIRWSDEDECWIGRTTNTPDDIIGFHADTVDEIIHEFQASVASARAYHEEQGRTLRLAT